MDFLIQRKKKEKDPHKADSPIGKSLYGRGSQSDFAAEFNICFQFQDHMAYCINSSR